MGEFLISLLWLIVYIALAAVVVWLLFWAIDLVVSLFPVEDQPPPRLIRAIKMVVALVALILVVTWLLGALPLPSPLHLRSP